MRRIAVLSIAGLLGALAWATPASSVGGFGDVEPNAFYTNAVQWMVDENITDGITFSCFAPYDAVTRGQAATFMWRMQGEPTPFNPSPIQFVDVAPGAFFEAAVDWMVAQGITQGTTLTTFSPYDVLNRGQLATFLWRLEGQPGGSPPNTFVDVPPGAFFEEAVNWMVAQDPPITTGTTQTTFSPYDPVTRGQVATFFHRYKGSPAVVVDSASPACPAPANPGDPVDCPDFPNQASAQSWHDLYFPFYGDIANLDGDNDGTACEESPGDTKNCGDFSTQAAAQAWFDFYFPLHGDVANLDGDGNGRPCESLS